MKNIVFIVDITLKGSQRDVGRWAESRSDPYVFCTKSWKKWCEKNNINTLRFDKYDNNLKIFIIS